MLEIKKEAKSLAGLRLQKSARKHKKVAGHKADDLERFTLITF